jgi:hypothetical protein
MQSNTPSYVIQTIPRPWNAGFDGELRRDDVAKCSCQYDAVKDRWEPQLATDGIVDLYVDSDLAVGDDDAPGDAANPLFSIQEAFNRLPARIEHQVTINLVQGSAGSPRPYDEKLTVNGFDIAPGASITVLGGDALAVLATGPNVLAPDPAATGTNHSYTKPGAGWTPGDLVGKFFDCNAGAGSLFRNYYSIIANTSDTLYFGSRLVFGGPFDVTTGGNIMELTSYIKQESIPFSSTTLFVSDIRGDKNTQPTGGVQRTGLTFEKIWLRGDRDLEFSLGISGPIILNFLKSRVDDYQFADNYVGGSLSFDESLVWVLASGGTASQLYRSSPNEGFWLSWGFTGLIGSLSMAQAGRWVTQWVASCGIPDANIPLPVISFGGGQLSGGGGRISGIADPVAGTKVAEPISLTTGAKGIIAMNDMILEDSPTSGIKSSDVTLSDVDIDLDQFAGTHGGSDFRNNDEYGVDLRGGRIVTHGSASVGTLKSTIINGLAGMRLREGATHAFRGTQGFEPTMAGGAGLNEIDFDNKSPAKIIRYVDRARGEREGCKNFYTPSEAPPPEPE